MVGEGDDGPVTVLIVDGNDDSCAGVADHLADSYGWIDPATASSAREGLEQLERDGIDCVVAAHELPDRDGLELLRSVRELAPDLPFILFPVEGSEAIASEAVALGVTGYLPREQGDGQYEALARRIRACTTSTNRLDSTTGHDLFEKLIRHSSDVVFVVDAAGDYQYVSPTIEQVLGYEPDELIGVNGFELVHPDDLERTQTEFSRAIEDPEYQPFVEFRAEHRDGDWRWLEVHGNNLFEDPDIEGFVVNARDVTERKEYGRRVVEQERRLHTIAEHLPETVIWMTDSSFSDVQFVSPGYEDIWGRPREALYEDPGSYLEGVHPDDRGRVLAAMADLTTDGEAARGDVIEYRVVQPDGTVRWVQGKTVPVEGGDDEIARWVGIATDITSRKASERAFEGYETVHRTVPDGVFLVDETGTMSHANEAWANMLGMERAAVEGHSFTSLVEEGFIDESVPNRYSELLRELLSDETDRDRGTIEIETTLPGREAEHLYEAHIGLLPFEEEFRGSAVVVRDVTRLRRRYGD